VRTRADVAVTATPAPAPPTGNRRLPTPADVLAAGSHGYALVMTAGPPLSLPEWTVLAVLAQRSAHGFAIAQLTARGGELGRVWQIPRPVIYRAIGRLVDAGLITPTGVQPGLGPQRTIYTPTEEGRMASARWLNTPVEHVREVRSHLLLKLALLDRAGADPTDLLRRQRAVLEPIARAIEADCLDRADNTDHAAQRGFDATLLAWRRASAAAAMGFLDSITEREPQP
jgi:DNA-binding PadR family transcriptional regulator